jgi:hypothetical protein
MYRPPGGFVGPYLAGALQQRTGGWGAVLLEMGACLGAAALMVLLLNEAWARGLGPGRRKRAGAGDAGAPGGSVSEGGAPAERGVPLMRRASSARAISPQRDDSQGQRPGKRGRSSRQSAALLDF